MKATLVFFQVLFLAGLYSTRLLPFSAALSDDKNKSPSILTTQPNYTRAYRDYDNLFQTGYITTDMLHIFKDVLELYHEDWSPTTFFTGKTFPREVDVVFRIFMGINSSDPLLRTSKPFGGFVTDRIQVNQPFIAQPPATAHSIQTLLERLSDGTSKFLFYYEWIGGEIVDSSHDNSFQSKLSTKCSTMGIRFSDGRSNEISWEIISTLDGFMLIIFPLQHASYLCGGDSLFFNDSSQMSQRLVFTDLNDSQTGSSLKRARTALYENIDEKDINSGSSAPRIVHITTSSPYFRDIKEVVSEGDLREYTSMHLLLSKAKEEFEYSLASYNNFGFALLNIASLASSTIVAIATTRGSRRVESAIVVVEAVVVSFFLIVLTYVLLVFLRADSLFIIRNIDGSSQHNTTHNHGKFEVSASYRERRIIVRKNLNWPVELVLAEICAVISMIVVLFNLVRLFRKQSDDVHTDDEVDVIVELWTNEDVEEHSHDSP